MDKKEVGYKEFLINSLCRYTLDNFIQLHLMHPCCIYTTQQWTSNSSLDCICVKTGCVCSKSQQLTALHSKHARSCYIHFVDARKYIRATTQEEKQKKKKSCHFILKINFPHSKGSQTIHIVASNCFQLSANHFIHETYSFVDIWFAK